MATFINIGNDYINLDQIARVDFGQVCTIFFAKPGGSDKHIVPPAEVKKLRECLDSKCCCGPCCPEKSC
jgi:hypothetical protein